MNELQGVWIGLLVLVLGFGVVTAILVFILVRHQRPLEDLVHVRTFLVELVQGFIQSVIPMKRKPHILPPERGSPVIVNASPSITLNSDHPATGKAPKNNKKKSKKAKKLKRELKRLREAARPEPQVPTTPNSPATFTDVRTQPIPLELLPAPYLSSKLIESSKTTGRPPGFRYCESHSSCIAKLYMPNDVTCADVHGAEMSRAAGA